MKANPMKDSCSIEATGFEETSSLLMLPSYCANRLLMGAPLVSLTSKWLATGTQEGRSLTIRWRPNQVVLGDEGKPGLPAEGGITSLLMQDVDPESVLTLLERAGISATGTLKLFGPVPHQLRLSEAPSHRLHG